MRESAESLADKIIIYATNPFDSKTTLEEILERFQYSYGLAILPSFVQTAKQLRTDCSECRLIGLVGYPTGGESTKTKVGEIRDMVYEGADEFHVVINTSYILAGYWDDIQIKLVAVVRAAMGRPVSVIMEAAYLSDPQIMRLINLCVECGITNIGTSTGWLPNKPDAPQIKKIAEMVYNRLPLMVSGVQTIGEANASLDAGADRLIVFQQHANDLLSQLAF